MKISLNIVIYTASGNNANLVAMRSILPTLTAMRSLLPAFRRAKRRRNRMNEVKSGLHERSEIGTADIPHPTSRSLLFGFAKAQTRMSKLLFAHPTPDIWWQCEAYPTSEATSGQHPTKTQTTYAA